MGNDRKVNKQAVKKNTLPARIILAIAFTLLLSGAWSVPFFFETMTLWYKIGADKTILRSGQLAGMSALVLVMLQIILAVPGPYLEKLFNKASLARYHRINGLAILLLAASHVVLVIFPEGLANLPLGRKYWPEMIGMLVFAVTLAAVIFAYLGRSVPTSFKKWRVPHKILGYGVLVLLPVHVLFVSESFEHSLLRAILVFLFSALVLWVVVVKVLSGFNR